MGELADIERALMTALGTIAENWDALLTPSSGGGMGGTASSDVVTGLDRRISLRHEVTLSLNGWVRLIVDERNLKPWVRCHHGATVTLGWPHLGPTRPRCAARVGWAKDDEGTEQSGIHPVLGSNTIDLIEFLQRWARWFSGHEAAPDAVEEISEWANQVEATAIPPEPQWNYLGDCPFVVEDWFCSGQVRQRIKADEATCSDCGQVGPQEWWEDVITGKLREEMPLNEVPEFLYRYFGRRVARPTLHRWVKTGELKRIDYVRTPEWFNRGQVIDAVSQRWLAS